MTSHSLTTSFLEALHWPQGGVCAQSLTPKSVLPECWPTYGSAGLPACLTPTHGSTTLALHSRVKPSPSPWLSILGMAGRHLKLPPHLPAGLQPCTQMPPPISNPYLLQVMGLGTFCILQSLTQVLFARVLLCTTENMLFGFYSPALGRTSCPTTPEPWPSQHPSSSSLCPAANPKSPPEARCLQG